MNYTHLYVLSIVTHFIILLSILSNC